MALADSSCSTTPAISEDEDAVQVVIPDKNQVFSDMKAIVDYYETQTDMAQKKIMQAENRLVEEKNRVSELEKENETLQKKLEEAQELGVTVQRERTEHESQKNLLKGQVQYLQNQLRDGKEQVHSLLNITRDHMCGVRTFWNNFGDTSKRLINFFPVNETPTPAIPAPPTSNPRTSSKNPIANLGGRKEAPIPGSNLSSSPAKSRRETKKKHAKTKSVGWRMERIKSHLKGLSKESISARKKAELEEYMKFMLGTSQESEQSSSEESEDSSTSTTEIASTTKRAITARVTGNGEQAAKRTKN